MHSLAVWRWLLMRVSAMVLAVAVVVHLATIIYAIQGGLSAEEILSRTRGSIAWHMFYVVFVLAAAVHAAIGLQNVIREHTAWRGTSLAVVSAALVVALSWGGIYSLKGLFS